ncbi:cyclic nucleotide-binding domain-containing protein [Chenggangzhangella methanolivorans]|uniref:Cyclic nucleotide-binding domain-containing protein n=1 Tax=Chenggangzhangella methanolivorans TaxID=1437009 RepID=A0A9E6RI15_9HYPH|nr:cyclic nucleotide-binding domain-containing protein [Chenggangzhangella methanolivorans]QZO01821.1 cyclic nucleotide-binding domain-containing protein [Chenggangzhangella methanolivorans]
MALEDDIRTLSETPLLDQLGRDAQRLIAFSADRVRLAEGDELFREGERADCGYVVASGSLRLVRPGGEITVGRSTLVGELALIADVSRPATAVAVEPTEVLRIARGLFARLFDEYPDLARNLHARLAQRLKANVAELKSIEALLRR